MSKSNDTFAIDKLPVPSRFSDRVHAGQYLASRCMHLKQYSPIVLGLPRGGVVVAAEVARALQSPLDVLVVRKIGAPHHEEFGIGAIGEGGVQVMDPRSVQAVRATNEPIQETVKRETQEMERRISKYRGTTKLLDLKNRYVLLVDDGLATGVTGMAAVEAARQLGAKWVGLAVPVAAPNSLEALRSVADEVIAVLTPLSLRSVGEWYDRWDQTEDDEVLSLLAESREPIVHVYTTSGETLRCRLELPDQPQGVVVFVHGSGSGMESPRNRIVADTLKQAKLGTFLVDLLTESEAERDASTREHRFDIQLLSQRVVACIDALTHHPITLGLPIQLVGSSTGAAAALVAAASRPDIVSAVVSRGGRPDLAGDALSRVRSPTLLIVGGEDREVLKLNELARDRIKAAPVKIEVVPGATHLFEERGTLEQAAQLAAGWLKEHATKTSHPMKPGDSIESTGTSTSSSGRTS